MRNPKAVVALHGFGSVCPGHRDVKWGSLRTPADAVGIPATLELCTSLVAPGGAVPTSSRAAPTPVIRWAHECNIERFRHGDRAATALIEAEGRGAFSFAVVADLHHRHHYSI